MHQTIIQKKECDIDHVYKPKATKWKSRCVLIYAIINRSPVDIYVL